MQEILKKNGEIIRGINKEFKYFVDNIKDVTSGLFQNHRVDRIKKFIKKFDLSLKKGKFNDISDKEILEEDVCYIIKIKKILIILINILIFVKIVMTMMTKFL